MIDEVSPNDESPLKQLTHKKVIIVETIVLMLELALEYCLRKDQMASFKRVLSQLEQVLKITVLVCENNGTLSK
jgi:hypothetical protein